MAMSLWFVTTVNNSGMSDDNGVWIVDPHTQQIGMLCPVESHFDSHKPYLVNSFYNVMQRIGFIGEILRMWWNLDPFLIHGTDYVPLQCDKATDSITK